MKRERENEAVRQTVEEKIVGQEKREVRERKRGKERNSHVEISKMCVYYGGSGTGDDGRLWTVTTRFLPVYCTDRHIAWNRFSLS